MDFQEHEQHDREQQGSIQEREQSNNSNSNNSGTNNPPPSDDNRPEGIEQRNIQEMADNSPQRQDLAQLEQMLNDSPQSQDLSELQQMLDQHPQAQPLVKETLTDMNAQPPVQQEVVPLEGGLGLDQPIQEDKGGDTPPDANANPFANQQNTVPPPPNPEQDPDFIALKERTEQQSEQQKKHEPATVSSQKAQKAAVSPANEKRSKAANQQIQTMDGQQPKPFDAGKFKELLKAKIAAILPKDEESADKFKDSGAMNGVAQAAKNQVRQEKQSAAGGIEQATKQPLNTNAVPDRTVEPLAPLNAGKKPAELLAEKAMPKPKGEDQVEEPIDQGVDQVEQQMEQNDIHDEQLANSNEPQFLEALNAKNEAQTNAEDTKHQIRLEEQGQLQGVQQNAKLTGQQQMLGIHNDRKNALTGVFGQQQNTGSKDTAERQRISTEVNAIYDKTKQDVEAILNGLDTTVNTMFMNAANNAGQQFENYVGQKMAEYKRQRYEGDGGIVDGVTGFFVAGYDYVAGLPDEVNQFFVDGRERYLTMMDAALTQIANVVAERLNAAKSRIAQGRQQVADYVNKLPQNLQKIGREAANAIQSKFDSLDKDVDNKQNALIDSLAKQYVEAVQKIDERIEALKAANRGLLAAAWDALAGVIEFINEVRKTLTELLSKVIEVVGAILWDPVGFLGNVIDGVGQGLSNFVANIGTHLINGVVAWLTGEMSGVDIEMPDDLFSLEGMFSFVGQILGLSWEYFREKAVQHLGEKTVERLEKAYEIFQVVKEGGLQGLWEYLKDQFANIKEMVMEEIKSMLIQEVVEAGIEWLFGLLTPAGAFVKAVKMVIKVVQFFVEHWDDIVAMVNAFIDSLTAIVNGDVSAMAAAIENAMASTIPAIIGFLASLVGLDGLGERVQEIIQGIRNYVDSIIESLILKAKKWFEETKGGRKKGKGGADDAEADKDAPKEEEDPYKKTEDKRSPEEQQRDFQTATSEARTVMNDPEATENDVVIGVDQVWHKYNLDHLHALLKERTAEAEEWLLKGDLGEFRVLERIKRAPTKAENEAQVSDEDRAKHEQIAGEIETELKGMKPQDEESFEDFYARIKAAGARLEAKYQEELRAGIKITVEMVNSMDKDQKDGDVDVRVEIKPNALERLASIDFGMNEDEAEFQKALLEAFKKVAKANFNQSANGLEQDNTFATDQTQKALVEQSTTIHNKIVKVQDQYERRKDASDLSKASFTVGSLDLVVVPGRNNYIMPIEDDTVINSMHYSFGKNGLDEKKKNIDKFLNALKNNGNANATIGAEIAQMEQLLSTVANVIGRDNMDQSKEFIQKMKTIWSDMLTKSKSAKYLDELQKIFSELPDVKIFTAYSTTQKYAYHKDPPSVTLAKQLYQGFEESIKEFSHATFVAALVAEPSRNSVAHISNMLLLDGRSELTDETRPAPKVGKEKPNYTSSLVYEHLSMTQDGSQTEENKNVMNRHLRSIQVNPDLMDKLKAAYKNDKNDLNGMAQLMSDYLGVNRLNE